MPPMWPETPGENLAYYNNKLVLTGRVDQANEFWEIYLNKTTPEPITLQDITTKLKTAWRKIYNLFAKQNKNSE